MRHCLRAGKPDFFNDPKARRTRKASKVTINSYAYPLLELEQSPTLAYQLFPSYRHIIYATRFDPEFYSMIPRSGAKKSTMTKYL